MRGLTRGSRITTSAQARVSAASRKPSGWRPGRTARATSPTKRPQIAQEMMPIPRWAPRPRLLPLDRARRLRGDVERDSVDVRDLVDDAARYGLEQVVGKARPVGCHRVVGGNGPDHDRI